MGRGTGSQDFGVLFQKKERTSVGSLSDTTVDGGTGGER